MGEPETVIRVENLSKKYVISHQPAGQRESLRDVLSNTLRAAGHRLLGRRRPPPGATREEFWALRDVSFEVTRGEVVGIIGRNGAGKSTLLKVLSRITEPTTGRIEIDGRVASLLEVGTGFHPELTGRDNVFLNGAILGMSRAEIRRKFDEIVAFAEIDKFLDTPVKRYSSGMYMRLAFAVAAHLEPEVLIVDEVLAVGDASFQKKCLGKMGDVARGGRTVFFVSHNMEAVAALCGRCVVLQGGAVRADGPPSEAIRDYRRLASPDGAFVKHKSPRLTWTGLQNVADLNGLSPVDDLVLRLGFRSGPAILPKFSVDVALANERNERVLHAKAAFVTTPVRVGPDESFLVEYRFISPRLAPGAYTLTVYAEDDGRVEFWADNIECLSVRPAAYFGRALVFEGLTAAVIPQYEFRVLGEAPPAAGGAT